MLFQRKNKKITQGGPSGPEVAPFSPPPTVEVEQTELGRKTEVVRQGKELLSVVDSQYGGFLEAAKERGMNDADVQAALIDGWNAGALPRTVRGETFRGGGDELFVLHGEVPTGFFDGMREDDITIDLDGQFRGVRIYKLPHDTPYEATTGEPGEFYVETHMLAQNVDRLDEEQQKSAMEDIADSFPTPSE